MRKGKPVVINWGLDLRADELKPDNKYVWIGLLYAGYFVRDNFEQII